MNILVEHGRISARSRRAGAVYGTGLRATTVGRAPTVAGFWLAHHGVAILHRGQAGLRLDRVAVSLREHAQARGRQGSE
jgi:hypothetical protein